MEKILGPYYSNPRKRFSCIKWARSLFTIIIGTFLKETDDNDRRAILLLVMDLVIVAATWLHRRDDIRGPCETSLLRYVLASDMTSDVNKTTRFKTKAKTKTIGPGTTYSIPTVNEIIFTAQYSITFAHYQLHNQIHMKVWQFVSASLTRRTVIQIDLRICWHYMLTRPQGSRPRPRPRLNITVSDHV